MNFEEAIIKEFNRTIGLEFDTGEDCTLARDFLKDALAKYKAEILKDLDAFDLVEPCKPDCTPVEHAYHQGTWDAYLKLEKKLSELKGKNE